MYNFAEAYCISLTLFVVYLQCCCQYLCTDWWRCQPGQSCGKRGWYRVWPGTLLPHPMSYTVHRDVSTLHCYSYVIMIRFWPKTNIVRRGFLNIRVQLGWGGGWIRLTVGFQLLMVISPTASWIRWCMQCMRVSVHLSCLGRTIYARQFWVPSHRLNSEMNHSDHLSDYE